MLEPALVEHLESDGTLILGTVDPAGLPEATYAWALEVVDAGPEPRVRFLVPERATRTLANLGTTGRVAATVTDVETLVSAQLKGRVHEITTPTAAEARGCGRRFDRVAARIHETDGTPLTVLEGFRPGRVVAVTMIVDEVYDQTPGPVAGVRLAPTEHPT